MVALQEEMCLQESRKGEKKRKMERLRLTREEEGKRGRANATQHSTHPPLIMVCVYYLILYFMCVVWCRIWWLEKVGGLDYKKSRDSHLPTTISLPAPSREPPHSREWGLARVQH